VTEVKVSDKKPIRILHVDDEKNQLEFTKMFLEDLDDEVTVDSVADPLEAIQLQLNSYDVIISDYRMISMTGIELFRKVREKSNVPFILYTGRGSEEVAESAFEAGVDDYLKKESEPSHYQVLSKRIRQTVEKHRAEALYRKVVKDSRDGIVILVDGKIVFANDTVCQMYGYDGPESFIGKTLTEFVVETEEETYSHFDSNQFFEINFKTSTGAVRSTEVSVSKIIYLGKPAFLCYLRDITKTKRTEERLEALHKQATKLAKITTVEEVAGSTLDIMQTVFEYQVVSFQVVDDGYLKMIDIRGAPMPTKPLTLNGKGIMVKAVRERKSILVNYTEDSFEFVNGSTHNFSELVVPAVLRGKTVALLYVMSHKPYDFTDEDRKLLETLAYHVSFSFDTMTEKSQGKKVNNIQ
jgi:PAS domain S-box-containing protein